MQASWKKTFALIFSGQIFSILTSSMVQFAIIWHLTETAGSATVLMIAGLAGFLPQALLGPFIGVWLDRWNRKTTMIVADSAIAFFSLALGLYFYFGEPSLAFVYLILMIRSAATAFHAPAFQAAIPLIAPESQLTRVAGWHQLVFSSSYAIGPALGIAVYTFSSLGAVLLLDVVGALIANIMLAFASIPQPKPEAAKSPSFLKEFKLGWQAFTKVKPIVIITAATAIFTIAFMPLAVLFPYMTYSHFGRGGFSASLIEAVFSIGMILGGVLLSVLGSKWKDIAYMTLSLVLIGLSCLFSGLLGKEAFVLFVILSFIMGFAAPLYNGPHMALLQKTYDPSVLGRVISFITSFDTLCSPIGLFAAGPVVDRYGVATWFVWSGAVMAFTGFLILTQHNELPADKTAEG